jgi:hypothetical protein
MEPSGKEVFRVTWWPVLIASLCCLAPVILVLLGLSTVAFAASLSDVLYGQYKWAFRAVGLALLTSSVIFYLRRQRGVCTLDDVRRRRNEVMNIVLIVFIAGVLGYVLWLYVVVEIIGIMLGIWG